MSLYDRVSGKIYKTYFRGMLALHEQQRQRTGLSALLRNITNDKPQPGFESICTAHPRSVQILPADRDLQEAVLTCYFVHLKDPQSHIVRVKADIDYIAPWYRSMERLGLYGIIIHDGLEEDFIAQYQTDKISFRRYNSGNYSIFEERWIAYYLFLSGSGIQRAFCTDINDVYITRSPFALISNELALYVGRDNANKIKDSGWLLEELRNFEQESGVKAPQPFYYQSLYNAGVLGGSRQVLLFFLSRIIDYVVRTHSSLHKDMTILNLCIYDHFFPQIVLQPERGRYTLPDQDQSAGHTYLITGYPLNSPFKAYDMDSDAYFIHK